MTNEQNAPFPCQVAPQDVGDITKPRGPDTYRLHGSYFYYIESARRAIRNAPSFVLFPTSKEIHF
jgi:hypothetical protein